MIKVENIPKPLRKEGLKDKIPKICEENDVVFMALFGSFVRGEQRENSDIDIAIKYRPDAKKSLFDVVHLEDELGKIFGRRVDLGELEGINKHVKKHVKKEMVVLYEAG